MINYKKVAKVYSTGSQALVDVNLNIKAGEFISVVGQSGAGKSTLLKLLYAEERPTSGDVIFNGENLIDLKNRHLPFHRRKIGTVFQDFKLLPKKTIFENVAFAMEAAGRSDAEIFRDVPQILEIVNLKNKVDKYPGEISGGEQQRAALARALVNKPKVLVADEPTGNLDPISTWDIIQLLLKINEIGTTVILATHNKGIVDKICRRVVVLDKGKIIRDDVNGKYCI